MIRRMLAGGLGLSLGWWVALASAGEPLWRPRAFPAAPSLPARATVPLSRAVSLGRPIPLFGETAPAAAITDPQLTQAAFRAAALVPPQPLVAAGVPEVVPFPFPAAAGIRTAQVPPQQTPLLREAPGEGSRQAPSRELATPSSEATIPPLVGEQEYWEEFESVPPAFRPWRASRLYGNAAYLLWTIRDSRLPPLVTTGLVENGGVGGDLGRPGTVLLFGGSTVSHEVLSGGRFTIGYWFDPFQTWGLEGNYFFLGERSIRFGASSDTIPVLSRPFFNLNAGREDREVVASPGLARGGIDVTLPSRLWGTEANLRHHLLAGPSYRVDLLAGFRYLELKESLGVVEDVQVLPDAPSPFAGGRFLVADQFGVRNQFYGGQLGTSVELNWRRWSLGIRSLIALGSNHQVVTISGSQLLRTAAGEMQSFRGGLLALPSNSGRFTRDQFAVVPQLGVNLSYQATERLRLFVGYDVLVWTNVLRPGDQIDRVLDVSQIPNFPNPPPPTGQGRPRVVFADRSFWAQGVNFGMEFRY